MVKKQIIQILKEGGIGVLPTDTMYGIVGSALNEETVAKIYHLRYRAFDKPLIVLIYSVGDLKWLGIKITPARKEILDKVWPGPVSVILPSPQKKFEHITRGTKTIAVRLPKNKVLLDILKQTGPLVAPSANLEGQPPSKTIKEAKKYFGNKIHFYIDGGKRAVIPSTLIKLKKTGIQILRSGAGDKLVL